MFTGIIEELGKIESLSTDIDSGRLKISSKKVLEDTNVGDSIAVNGVCLTVVDLGNDSFTADVMPETLRASNLGKLENGSLVNLERALSANGRFGGHIVSGHIDGIGYIESLREEGNATWVTISADPEILKYIVKKGSIAIDGISLTVADLTENTFSVSVIPHTGEETILLQKKVGDTVNLENDILGKYVERLLEFSNKNKNPDDDITMEFLLEHGF